MKRYVYFILILLFGINLQARETTIIKRLPQYGAGNKIKMSLKGGALLDVRGSKRSDVEIMIRYPDDYWYNIDEQPHIILIEGKYGNNRTSWKNRAIFTIKLPEYFDVEFESDGGNIKLSDLKGEFKGKTLGGSIDLVNLSGKIDLQTNGGDINVNRGDLDGVVRTLGGNIVISEVSGNLKGITNGGNLKYNNVYKQKYDGIVNLTTMGGDISIDEAPYGASVATQGGNISINAANNFVQARTKGGNIVLKNMRAIKIDAETLSGNIDVELLNIPDKHRTCHLNSNSGDIVVIIPKSSEPLFDIRLAYTKNSLKQFKIKSDFDIDITETPEWDFTHGTARKYIYGKGKIGSGKNVIDIKTVNGNIILQKK